MNFGEVKNQLLYQLNNVIVRRYPYPHFHCPKLFSDPFYDEIMQRMPDPEVYTPITLSGGVQVSESHKQTYDARGIISLGKDRDRISPADQGFWRSLYEIFVGPDSIPRC